VVENMRAAVKHRLKVAYDDVRAVNPRIVYGSISGFGQTGPYALRAGVDQIAQGMGGLMSVTGAPGEGPMRVGIPVADLAAGLFCAIGILTALLERDVSGEGQWVQTSLLQAQIFMLDFQAARWLMEKDVAKQAGNNHPTSIPTGVFATSDGHINIAASGDDIFVRFCKAIDAPELASAADYATGAARSANRDGLNAAIEAATRTRPSAEWIERLNKAGVPCGPIYKINEVFADPQVRHLNITRHVTHPLLGDEELIGQAIELSRSKWSIRTPTPEQGEHTLAILGELGYAAADIAALREREVV